MSLNPKHRPFLKWAGNKYRCLSFILPRLSVGKRLIEPFAGSGAIFLNCDYPTNLLNDQNSELINLFEYLKTEGQVFIEDCRQWFLPENNSKNRYYELRELFNASRCPRERAMLFLYLNRHGFNGLCRFNLKGRFNVPFGSYIKPYFPENEMLFFHEKTKNCIFSNKNFTDIFKLAEKDDVIYCDPPYHPLSATASFTSYTKQQFLKDEQITLAKLATEATHHGTDVFISNHDTAFTRELYKKATHIYRFKVARTISSKGDKRQPVAEILAHFKAL